MDEGGGDVGSVDGVRRGNVDIKERILTIVAERTGEKVLTAALIYAAIILAATGSHCLGRKK